MSEDAQFEQLTDEQLAADRAAEPDPEPEDDTSADPGVDEEPDWDEEA